MRPKKRLPYLSTKKKLKHYFGGFQTFDPFEYGKSFHNKYWNPNPTQPQYI